METDELLKKRFRDLARKSYQNNQYTFTGFLSPADMACFYELERELAYVPSTVWGGSELCERVMVRFGSPRELGYEEEFPIACVQVRPLAARFADALTHRDFLGALMNLGIERSTLGDILFAQGGERGPESGVHTSEGNACSAQGGTHSARDGVYIFCQEKMADFIIENLGRVKHTSVLCSRAQQVPALAESDRQEIRIQVSSPRIDGVLAKVYRLSRGDALELFRQRKVLLGGRICENNSQILKDGDIVSARGYGKFEYTGEQGISKKGKINATIVCYGKR